MTPLESLVGPWLQLSQLTRHRAGNVHRHEKRLPVGRRWAHAWDRFLVER